jgi:hypothetical protein
MAFGSLGPSGAICVQGRPDLLGFTASGTIKAGQCLIAVGTMQAKACTAASPGFIGVAAYDKSDGEPVATYGAGSICWVRVSGASKCTVADDLHCGSEGKVTNAGGTTGTKIGVALETQATTGGRARMLITG